MDKDQTDRLIYALEGMGEGLRMIAAEMRHYNLNVYERETNSFGTVGQAIEDGLTMVANEVGRMADAATGTVGSKGA